MIYDIFGYPRSSDKSVYYIVLLYVGTQVLALGEKRYGTPDDLGNSEQAMKVSEIMLQNTSCTRCTVQSHRQSFP